MRASVLLGNGAGGKGLEKVPGPEGWEGNAMAGAAPASGQGGNGRLGINGKEGKGSRVRWTPAVCPPWGLVGFGAVGGSCSAAGRTGKAQ